MRKESERIREDGRRFAAGATGIAITGAAQVVVSLVARIVDGPLGVAAGTTVAAMLGVAILFHIIARALYRRSQTVAREYEEEGR